MSSFPYRGIVGASCFTTLGMFQGNPRSRSTGSDDDGSFNVVLSPEGIIWSRCWLGKTRGGAVLHLPQGRRHVSVGMMRRSLGSRRIWMEVCRMVALSDLVVTLMVVWRGEVNALITPEGGMAEDGGS